MMIFAFLRPGVAPAFESQNLISIVESNFIAENTWSSISVPIAVRKISDSTFIIEAVQEQPAKWDFVSYYSPQNLTLLNINVDINPGKIKIACKANSQCKTVTSSSSELVAGIYLTAMENDETAAIKDVNITVKCVPPGGNAVCDYLVVAKEIFSGLKESNLLMLSLNPIVSYSQKKNDWNFPETRDFSVSLDYLNGSSQIDLIKPGYPLPESLNIFVKELSIPILNQDASRTPAKINIKVW